MKIYARKNEKKLLQEIYRSKKSEFLAVYGRRRVGKTYLIKNFYENKGIFFHITGTPRATTQQQLWNFSNIFSEVFNNSEPIETPSSWQEAFYLLKNAINKKQSNRKVILFFDELPWLANKKSGFIDALTYLWNRFLENDPRLIFIVCGSAASWMIKNVVDNRGGLYNRITKKIRLEPFNLFDTEKYLKQKNNISLSRKQIIDIYMAIGGVAAYLDLIRPGQSSSQIISEIIFNNQSPLSGEFDRLFKSLFNKSDIHKKIVKTLAENKMGIDRNKLFNQVGIKSGSVKKRVINELLESGFISKSPFFGNRKKGELLRLVDEYSAFYLKWHREIINCRLPVNPDYWLILQNSGKYKTWSGYAFETLCMNHIDYIARTLGISGIIYSYSSWSHLPANKADKGVQIDLLIDRTDNCINLCELKFHNSQFTISKEYANKLIYKKQKFIEQTKTNKTIFITMITFYGTKENEHYREIVNNQITIQHL
jgi:hypothetical protein